MSEVNSRASLARSRRGSSADPHPSGGETTKQMLGRIFSMRNIAVVALVVYFAVFMAYPIFSAFAGSLHDWNPLIDKYDWVGFDNFVDVLTDGLFWKSLWNTAVFAFFSILFRVVLGLALALLLSSKLVKCKDTLRGLFYMPTITPLVAVSFVWMWMFDPQFGMIDKITGLDISWLVDVRSAVRHDRQDHRTRHQLAQRFALRHAGGHHHDHLEGFRLRHRAVSRRHHGAAARRVRGGADRRRQLVADLPVDRPSGRSRCRCSSPPRCSSSSPR